LAEQHKPKAHKPTSLSQHPSSFQKATAMSQPDHEQQARNRRLGLILATVAVAFALGFVAKVMLLGL
jgi:hypothetical protein